jgi:hypothetical protein
MEAFKYQRQCVGNTGLEPAEDMARAEVEDRLIGWVIDPEVAIKDLEIHPGEWTRITGFAFYRAVLRDENQEVKDV